jgi:hypothetical protein
MTNVLKTNLYTITVDDEDAVTLRTKRRGIRFASLHRLYMYSLQFQSIQEYIGDGMKELRDEQKADGIHDAFTDFRDWYESRKSRAKIHVRMVAKLLYWHKLSVEKLSENHADF